MAKTFHSIMHETIDKLFKDEYAKYKRDELYTGYRLEQCGKHWRVMQYSLGDKEAKTGWLTYKEADALLKIFKSGEEHGNT